MSLRIHPENNHPLDLPALTGVSIAGQAQILVGQTTGFTGPSRAGVKETTDGAMLYIEAVNARGDINGQKN